MKTFSIRILATLGFLVIILAGYKFIARPYQLNWGATDAEIFSRLPGDELGSNPDFLATRAISINAEPQEIWPWIIQMGYNRAGFYGYDLIENLGSKSGIRSAERIIPEYQAFQAGDPVPISAVHTMKFYAVEPFRYFIWSGQDNNGSFLWMLQPVNSDSTRLISRIQWSYDLSNPQELALALFTEFTDHIAVRKILTEIKGRVEGEIEPMAQQNAELSLFFISFVVFLVSLILILLNPFRWSGWLASLGAGIAWLITWYGPVNLWGGILLTSFVVIGLVAGYRK